MSQAFETTKLGHHVDAYLAHWRALGRRYRQEEWLLRAVTRDLAALGHDDLTAQSHDLWLELKKDRHPNSRRKWAQRLRHFCLFRRRLSPECFVPGPEQACKRRPHVTPIIVGDDEVAKLLLTADRLTPAPGSPLRAATMRIATVLLYTTGIRLGELQRLRLSDVEDDGSILRIRASKFQKTRLVPLSLTAQAELADFMVLRTSAGFAIVPSTALLAPHPGRSNGYSISGLQSAITALFRNASVNDGNGRCPRIHDLRHSFAIQVLTRAYREGDDVQVLLPKLAMYMGHVSIESTAYYLQWREELGILASERFATRFADVISGRPS
ncbi:tyrosine-type recombinase/integrase [Labrenzia sp. DG1229]|uniref:tyrosine-type recombinase/integrase n=1 Tax=Labrenzia sp. DG1229 TaxID=681847 RepID=UPI00048B2EFF|nr:tyrosine-type recombinase/integrase [Labrenzia sp. DG1229]